MALYQPINVYPYMDTIDMTKENIFSMQIKGNKCVGYTMKIWDVDNNTGNLLYTSPTADLSSNPLYNNDVLDISVPSNISNITNGKYYKWSINLQAENYTEITHGSIHTVSSPYIYIKYNSNIKIGQYFKTGTTISTITGVYMHYSGTYDWESQITISETLPTSGQYYEVLSGSISNISYYQFNTATTRTLSINNTAIVSPYCEFTATSTQAESVPIKKQTWELYLINDTEEQLINTKEIESENLKYSYSCFINGMTYKIKLTTLDENNLEVSTDKTIVCDYTTEPTSVSDIVATNEDGYVGINFSSVILPTNYQYTLVYREDIIDGSPTNYKFIEKITSGKLIEKDYNISNNHSYRYGFIFVGDNINTCFTNTILVNNWNWYIIGLKESIVDEKYYADTDNIWVAELDVSSGTQKLNMDVTVYDTLGQFAKISKGNKSYISSDLSFKIGDITNGVYSNSSEMIDNLYKFCANSQLKLLKNRLGDKYIIDIISDPTNKTLDETIEQANDIILPWIQIGDADLISVVNEI